MPSRRALAFVSERVGFLAQRDPHRGAGQSEILAQRIHEIALIGLRNGVGAGAEQDETRRTRLGLRDVVQLQPAARYGGGGGGEGTRAETRRESGGAGAPVSQPARQLALA